MRGRGGGKRDSTPATREGRKSVFAITKKQGISFGFVHGEAHEEVRPAGGGVEGKEGGAPALRQGGALVPGWAVLERFKKRYGHVWIEKRFFSDFSGRG